MKSALVILRNLQIAVQRSQQKTFDQILFCPIYHSPVQEAHCRKLWSSLQIEIPAAQWVSADQLPPLLKDCTEIEVAGWDCSEERQLFKGLNLDLQFLPQNRLYQSWDVTGVTSFTQFRKDIEKFIKKNPIEDGIAPYETAVNNHLHSYFYQKHLAKTYFETRNGLLHPDDSTGLSAHLSWGTLDVRYLWNYILDYEKAHGSNKSTYWIRFELLWREFFHHIGDSMQDLLFSRNGLKGPSDFTPPDPPDGALATFVKEPLMKAAWRQLSETGFLSNRMRQWFASHWIFADNLDWLFGAQLFEQNLIDYDVYSNYGNWQYIAGVGYDPRGGREFNLKKQLEMYDPQGAYLKHWS
jgi:deoxyribodipyrimidine photolyase